MSNVLFIQSNDNSTIDFTNNDIDIITDIRTKNAELSRINKNAGFNLINEIHPDYKGIQKEKKYNPS